MPTDEPVPFSANDDAAAGPVRTRSRVRPMTVKRLHHPATARTGMPGRPRTPPEQPHPARHRQGPSPERGELVRPLTRYQIADHMAELGELYTNTLPSRPRAFDHPTQDRSAAFLRRLAGHMRRPGFELLVAETTGPSGATVITACAYGFPVGGDDSPWWQELDGYLPANLLRLAAPGGLFAIGDILVERRVRTQDQGRDWNLARRLQTRLLDDHTAALGVMLVDRGDAAALEALQSWGWSCLPTETGGMSWPGPRRLLVLR